MDIVINLPENISANTYKELRGYLKQFELAIHHAQKAVENAEETGVELTEDAYICFEHPSLEGIEGDVKGADIPLNLYDELQNIQLKISLK